MRLAWDTFGSFTPTGLIAAGVAALIVVAVFIVGAFGGRRRALRMAPWAMLCVYVIAILVATLGFTTGDGNGRSGINVHPFQEIDRGLKSGAAGVTFANVWGNVAMFVPLGALLVWLLTSPLLARVVMATIAGAGLSLVIELAQLTLHRVADIDDIILNGAGALSGAIAAAVLGLLVRLVSWVVRRLRGSPRDGDAAA